MRPQLYVIRGPDGKPQAIHQRADGGPKDKRFSWWTSGPDGKPIQSLQGRAVESLALFGSQHVVKWDTSRPMYVVEGEKAVMALADGHHRALGTYGSSPTPSEASLAMLIGFDVRLWPDADRVGRRLMVNIAKVVKPAVRSLCWVEWPDAPDGGDAADYLAAGLRVEDLHIGPVPKVPKQTKPSVPMWRRASLAPRSDLAPLTLAIRQAALGNRNALLFCAAHKAADSGIGRDLAEGELLDAYLADEPTPIRQREGRATIRSAYR
jgi:hypothetical protein